MRATLAGYGTCCPWKVSLPGLRREKGQPVPYWLEADKPVSEVVVEQGE